MARRGGLLRLSENKNGVLATKDRIVSDEFPADQSISITLTAVFQLGPIMEAMSARCLGL